MEPPIGFDLSILTAVVQQRSPWLDDAMVFASAVGEAGFVWLLVVAIGVVFPDRRAAAWRLGLTVLATYLVVDFLLKPLFDRPRPFEVLPDVRLISAMPTTASFPSAHAALGFAGALAGARVFRGSGWILWPLGVLIACSRVYLGVHWPSDVVAGAIIGLACAWFVLGGGAATLRA